VRGVYVSHFDQIPEMTYIVFSGTLNPTHFTSVKKFQYWGSYTLTVASMGVKFGMGRGPLVPSSMPNFTPIGATCRPCGAKNLKIGLRVN